jgi:hypothetical protein
VTSFSLPQIFQFSSFLKGKKVLSYGDRSKMTPFFAEKSLLICQIIAAKKDFTLLLNSA